jgi:hypothetical protein
MTALITLINIGPVISKKLQKIGINSAEEFLSRDPYQVFDELLVRVDPTLCRCALGSIIGAKEGIKWNIAMKTAVPKFEKEHPGHKWVNC